LKISHALAGLWLVFGGFVATSACTLAVDLDALENGECGEGKKFCGSDGCVDIDNTSFGCTATGCAKCNLIQAVPVCRNDRCEIAECRPDRGNCDNNHANGCETDLKYNVDHCGRCNNKCALGPNVATAECANSKCAIRACANGFSNCNNESVSMDGCETVGACPP